MKVLKISQIWKTHWAEQLYATFFEKELEKRHKEQRAVWLVILWKLITNTSARSLIDETRNKSRIYFLYLPRTWEMPPTKTNDYRVQHLAQTEMIQAGSGPLIMFLKDWVVRLIVVEDGHYLCNVKANIFMNQTFPKLQTKMWNSIWHL